MTQDSNDTPLEHGSGTAFRPESEVPTFLLVEDLRSIRLMLQDGEAGLVLGASFSGPIDVLVTDIVMSKLNGVELARRLCQTRPNLKVLFMSGYIERAIVPQDMMNRQVDILSKPFTPQIILEYVRQLLA